jgi:hypothetical protein
MNAGACHGAPDADVLLADVIAVPLHAKGSLSGLRPSALKGKACAPQPARSTAPGTPVVYVGNERYKSGCAHASDRQNLWTEMINFR